MHFKVNVRDSELNSKLSSELFRSYQTLRDIVDHHYMLPEIKEMVDKKGRLLEKLEETDEERERYNTFKNSLKIQGDIYKLEEKIRRENILGNINSHSHIKEITNDVECNKYFIEKVPKVEMATEFYRLVCENLLLLNFIKNYFHAYYTKSIDFMVRLFLQLEESKKALNVVSKMINRVQNFEDPDKVAKRELNEDSENEEEDDEDKSDKEIY